MEATLAEPQSVWTVRMNRTDPGNVGGKWTLTNEGDVLVLRSPEDEELGRFTAAEAHGKFELPNLGAHKYLGIDLGDVKAQFAPWPKDAKRITSFVHTAPEASSADARAVVRKGAVFQLVIAFALAALGVGLTVGGTGRIWYGLVLCALFPLMKSFHGFRHLARLSGLAAARSASDPATGESAAGDAGSKAA